MRNPRRAKRRVKELRHSVEVTTAGEPGRPTASWAPYLLFAALLGALILASGFPYAKDYGMPAWNLRTGVPYGFLIVAVASIAAWRISIPPGMKQPGRVLTIPCLLACLALAAWLRSQRLFEPIGPYWDDTLVNIYNPRNLLDFKEGGAIFPFGIPAFPPYWSALLWGLCPNAEGFVVQRIAPLLTDLIGVWLMYLAGKEYGGTRTGLWAAALTAVSKPVILACVSGQGSQFMLSGVALFLLFTARVLKRPDPRRYAEWGIAAAFGIYTYNAYRPVVLFAVAWTFLALVVRSWRKSTSFEAWSLATGTLGLFSFEFIRRHRFISSNPWDRPLWIGVAVTVAVVLLAMVLRESRGREGSADVARWWVGVALLAAVVYPIAQHPEFANHVRKVALFDPNAMRGPSGFESILRVLVGKMNLAAECLFVGGPDRSDMNLPNHPFFEHPWAGLALLGSVLVLVNPSFLGCTLLATAMVGIMPHVLSSDPYSSKLAVAAPPILLLGALTLSRVEEGLRSIGRIRWARLFALGSLAGVLFTAGVNRAIVYEKWFEQLSPDVRLYRGVRDAGPNEKIYLAPFHPGFYTATQSALLDRRDARTLLATNPLETLSDGRTPDLMVVVSGRDAETLSRMEREYPDASREVTAYPDAKPEVAPFMVRYRIKGDTIGDDPARLFYRAPRNPWIRRVYGGHYGLCHGIVLMVESARGMLDPVSALYHSATARIDGRIRVEHGGRFEFKVRTLNYAVLDIAGKSILDLRPKAGRIGEQKRTVRLKAGVHPVVLKTYFQRGTEVPNIEFRRKGDPDWRSLSDAAVIPE